MERRREAGSTLLKKNSLLLKPAMGLPPRVHQPMSKQGQCVSVFLSLCLPKTLYCIAFEQFACRNSSQRVQVSGSSNFNLHYTFKLGLELEGELNKLKSTKKIFLYCQANTL